MTERHDDERAAAARRQGVQRFVAGAVIEHAGSVLLLQRQVGDFMGGLFELPSGHVEDGETLLDALHREVAEETGMTLNAAPAYVGSFDYTSGSGRLTRQFNYAVSVPDPTVLLSEEHVGYRWARPDDLAAITMSDETRTSVLDWWHQPAAGGRRHAP